MDRLKTPEVAVLVSTYQRPRHLERCLLSIALQQGLGQGLEVVVTDDGSQDETRSVVETFARSVDFPVRFTTHPHTTFQLARCRNEGVAASTAPYLIFLDGDCILPVDHVHQHLARRRKGIAYAGYCICLDEATSERVTSDVIRRAEFTKWGTDAERWKLWKLDIKSRFYQAIRHPLKPRLFGGNIGISRQDYERVNGYDENFQGWGCEDDDLRIRLRRAGVRIASILRWTRTYHLWHPPGETTPSTWRQGNNVAYLNRPYRLTQCRNGLTKRPAHELRLRVVGKDTRSSVPSSEFGERISTLPCSIENSPAEVEILVAPGPGRFSGKADCNILVLLDPSESAMQHLSQAHVLVTDQSVNDRGQRRYRLHELADVLRDVA